MSSQDSMIFFISFAPIFEFIHMQRLLSILLTLTLTGFILSCSRVARDDKHTFVSTFSTLKADTVTAEHQTVKRDIYFGVLNPVEISEIFNRLDAVYTPEILSDPSNADHYLSSSKAAINLGIYGTDLGYLNMFSLKSEMARYMRTIRTLSNNLGIPIEYLTDPVKELEKSMTDSDSVMKLINRSYRRIEDHLRAEGRESTAGLIMLGGWIEAVYISTQLLYDYENPDPEVVERIAEQKYTLNALLSFLKNYYDDPIVVYYTHKLRHLKRYFDRFDIFFAPGDLEVDNDRQVLKASGSEMTITVKTLGNIRDYVAKMRVETVEF